MLNDQSQIMTTKALTILYMIRNLKFNNGQTFELRSITGWLHEAFTIVRKAYVYTSCISSANMHT